MARKGKEDAGASAEPAGPLGTGPEPASGLGHTASVPCALADEVVFYAKLEQRVSSIRNELAYRASARRYPATFSAGFNEALDRVLIAMFHAEIIPTTTGSGETSG